MPDIAAHFVPTRARSFRPLPPIRGDGQALVTVIAGEAAHANVTPPSRYRGKPNVVTLAPRVLVTIAPSSHWPRPRGRLDDAPPGPLELGLAIGHSIIDADDFFERGFGPWMAGS